MKKLFATPGVKGVCICVILFLIMVAFLSRPILVLYHQQQAGKIIDKVASNIEGSDVISYRCFLGQLLDEPPTEVDEAIKHLLTALELPTQNAQTVYLLGQAYCLNQEFDSAIDIFKQAQMSKEYYLNTNIELGFAYYALANQEENFRMNQEKILSSGSINLAVQAFIKGHLNPASFILAANDAFEMDKLNIAFYLYDLASIYQPLSDSENFRLYLLAQIIGQPERFSGDQYNLPILQVADTLTIFPEHMYRLGQIKPLSRREVAGKTYGIIFSKNSDAVMLVDIVEKGEYLFKLSMLDRPPAPTKLEVSIDFQPLVEINLSNGDDQLVVDNFQTDINSGVHLISIKLLNDAQVNGVDRNGHIFQVKISEIQ